MRSDRDAASRGNPDSVWRPVDSWQAITSTESVVRSAWPHRGVAERLVAKESVPHIERRRGAEMVARWSESSLLSLCTTLACGQAAEHQRSVHDGRFA